MIPNQTERLNQIIFTLRSNGQDISGVNGGKIIRQLAYELRDQGAGLFKKSSGNQFEGHSVDWILFTDGMAGDVIGDAGGANSVNWNLESHPEMLSGFTRIDEDPGYLTNNEPDEPGQIDYTPLLIKLDELVETLQDLIRSIESK